MSGLKMQMRLLTKQSKEQNQINENKQLQQRIVRTMQNQNSFIKLGYSGKSRNYTALIVQGQKFCKSCNDKK